MIADVLCFIFLVRQKKRESKNEVLVLLSPLYFLFGVFVQQFVLLVMYMYDLYNFFSIPLVFALTGCFLSISYWDNEGRSELMCCLFLYVIFHFFFRCLAEMSVLPVNIFACRYRKCICASFLHHSSLISLKVISMKLMILSLARFSRHQLSSPSIQHHSW